jgi:sigma-70-like protein
LPDRQRSALVMHVLEGHSYEEIARELSATPPMVRQLLYRARTNLRDGLGLLIPIPFIRAKVGASLFAAATIAGGTGVAVQQHNEHHSRSTTPPKVARPVERPTSPAPEQARVVTARSTRKADGVKASSHVEIADRNSAAGSPAPSDTATEPDQHQSGDEEVGGRHGRSGDRDEEGTEARLPSDEDGEHGDSEHPSGDGSGDHSGKASGGDSQADSGPGSDEPSGSDPAESDGSP